MDGAPRSYKPHLFTGVLGGMGGREAKVLGLVLHLGGQTPPLACFTVRDSVGIGSNFMSVLLVCGWRHSDLPIEPRGADVMFLCSDGLLVGLSSFSNKWNGMEVVDPPQANWFKQLSTAFPLPSVIKANVVLSVSFDGHLRLFNKIARGCWCWYLWIFQ